MNHTVPALSLQRASAWRCAAIGLGLGIALVSANSATFATEPPQADATGDTTEFEFFEQRVRPILVERCHECHSEDAAESDLRVDTLNGLLRGGTRGPAIVVGDPQHSLLVVAINHSTALQMPPKRKLPQAEIAAISEWIRRGAKWPNAAPIATLSITSAGEAEYTTEQKSFWAFQSPQKPTPPAVSSLADGTPWVRTPIDAFVLDRLTRTGLSPAPAADRRTLIRRVTFDLTGLPPTPAEVQAFVDDTSPDAWSKVIDRLLQSPHYGERWGRYWLDVVRYADSNGLDENLAFSNAYRYRDYVIASFNNDKPFDRFVQEQIAGDLLYGAADPAAGVDSPEARDALTATSFLVIGAKLLAEDDPVKMQMDIIDEQVDTVGRAFLGLTLGCARCHDHKFDPISTRDYYGLAGIFKSTKTMESFRVVARWQERPLATAAEIAELRAHQARIDAAKSSLDRAVKTANEQVLSDARRNIGQILLAVHRQQTADSRISNTGGAEAIAARHGGVLLEAENYTLGNVVRDQQAYGQGIGVIYNAGQLPNVAQYDFELKTAGSYAMYLRYAAEAARPVKLLINGKLARSDAAGRVTGGWHPDKQQWHSEGTFEFAAGKNTIRFERSEPFPHLDKLLVVPPAAIDPPQVGATPTEKPAGEMPSYQPPRSLVDRWSAYLNKIATNRASPFYTWTQSSLAGKPIAEAPAENFAARRILTAPAPQTLEELANRYDRMFAEIDAKWVALLAASAGNAVDRLPDPSDEALRFILYAGDGPLTLPKDDDASYDVATQRAIGKLRESLAALESTLPTLPHVMAVSEEKPEDLRVHLRGSHFTLGDTVPRRFPRILDGEKTSLPATQSGRLELARWLTRRDHPLTARVLVNRIWQGHFGTGLVRSPDNFGRLGDRPTHPELLDWLAVRFVEEGWSIKALHRIILQSSAYQMSTRFDARAVEVDPENRLYWRMNRRRLDVEAIRDSILAISGTLDRTAGGSLLPVENRKYVTSTANVDPVAYTALRRSVYMPVVRSALYNVFQAFDFPDPNFSNAKRDVTTVAPQALFMMNSELVFASAGAWATKLLAENFAAAGATTTEQDAARVRRAIESAYGRPAMDDEVTRSLDYLAEYASAVESTASGLSPDERRLRAWRSWCRVLLAANEFVYVE